MIEYENRLYLSERNLRILLSKLERYKAGDKTACTIIKYANPLDPYCSTIDEIAVIAVPDEKYYAAREPGVMKEMDVENGKKF
jgi:hypothetical protein